MTLSGGPKECQEEKTSKRELSSKEELPSVDHAGGSADDLERVESEPSSSEAQESSTTDPQKTPIDLMRIRASRELKRCNQLYHQSKFQEALSGYNRLVEELEDHKLLANVGYTLQALGRHLEAVEAFERYLETFIARHHAWKALCFSHYHLKDYENMTRCAREAIRWDIRLDTPDDYSWQQMATAHFLMGDYSTALKAARKASALNERNPYSRYYEACVISACVEGAAIDNEELFTEDPSYEGALELLKHALELRPELTDELKSEGYLDHVFSMLDAEQSEDEEPQSALNPTEN